MTGRTDRTTETAHSAKALRPPRGNNLRWMIVGMCFLGTSINYLDRANLSIAMPDIVKQFGISHTVEGLILGGFFWTYALFQLSVRPLRRQARRPGHLYVRRRLVVGVHCAHRGGHGSGLAVRLPARSR